VSSIELHGTKICAVSNIPASSFYPLNPLHSTAKSPSASLLKAASTDTSTISSPAPDAVAAADASVKLNASDDEDKKDNVLNDTAAVRDQQKNGNGNASAGWCAQHVMGVLMVWNGFDVEQGTVDESVAGELQLEHLARPECDGVTVTEEDLVQHRKYEENRAKYPSVTSVCFRNQRFPNHTVHFF
jgi:hypothetical protein